MDITNTRGLSYDNVKQAIQTQGSNFYGWRYATNLEFELFAKQFNFPIENSDTPSSLPAERLEKINSFTALLGDSFLEHNYYGVEGFVEIVGGSPGDHDRMSAYWYDRRDENPNYPFGTRYIFVPLQYSTDWFTARHGDSWPQIGHFLVRDASPVPEPSTVFLIGSGLVGLISLKKGSRLR